ncbi:cytochrome P450 [Lophiotrema nucula]|uniref:Cytochrome P450 n=1 Tax=Lophiotrema nucula TaxID=690887 RepID=A0A6A5YM65_9PLEO|nr:cytochrome P450 [Lophiotrema nucula]
MAATTLYLLTALIALTSYILNRLLVNHRILRALNIPGPILAKLSSKWLIITFARGEQMNTIHSLHARHGSIVQIGPKEISFASARACKDIYSVNSRCLKSPIYDNLGKPGLVGMRDKEQHRERLKRVSHVFAPSVLRELEPGLQAQIQKLVALIAKNEGRGFDIVKPSRMLALDIAGEVFLGGDFGALGAKEGEEPHYVQVMGLLIPYRGLETDVPWLLPLLKLLPFKRVKDFLGVVDYIYGFGEERVKQSIERYGRSARRKDLLTKFLVGDPEKGTLPLSDQEIADEVSNFIYAATDTTGVILSYFLYEMAANASWQEKLRQELEEARVREKGFEYNAIKQVPLLHACVYEVLRMHPGVGIGLPRITPQEGWMIDGIFIPGGVVVHTPTYTIQRNPSAFPTPDSFNPLRWLSSSDTKCAFAPTAEMQSHMFVWGGGEHVCAGMNMAVMEIKIVAVRVLCEFKIRVESEQTHKDMQMGDHFISEPKGGKGLCIFEKIE